MKAWSHQCLVRRSPRHFFPSPFRSPASEKSCGHTPIHKKNCRYRTIRKMILPIHKNLFKSGLESCLDGLCIPFCLKEKHMAHHIPIAGSKQSHGRSLFQDGWKTCTSFVRVRVGNFIFFFGGEPEGGEEFPGSDSELPLPSSSSFRSSVDFTRGEVIEDTLIWFMSVRGGNRMNNIFKREPCVRVTVCNPDYADTHRYTNFFFADTH